MNSKFAVLSFLFAVAFGFSLYLFACAGSISSDYQPGFGLIRWFHPALVPVLFFTAAWFLASRDTDLRLFLLLGLAECALLFLFNLIRGLGNTDDPVPPAPRTLWSTIIFSLTHPQFSNRSYAAVFYSAIILAILWLISRGGSRRRERSA